MNLCLNYASKVAAKAEKKDVLPSERTFRAATQLSGMLGGLVLLGMASPGAEFNSMVNIFALAGLVGYQVHIHTVDRALV